VRCSIHEDKLSSSEVVLLRWRADKAAAARVAEVRRLQGELADARLQLERSAIAETRLKADLAAAYKQVSRSGTCSGFA
jgi:hypothetical protein